MDTIKLTATIRDFRADHPDFENKRGPEEMGLVEPLLGPDGKPVYNSTKFPRGSSTTSGATTFQQWFNAVPGVNQEIDYGLTLDNSHDPTGKLFRIVSDAFFPIDGQLFGNIREELFVGGTGELTAVGQRLKAKKNANRHQSDTFLLTRPEQYTPNHNYHFTLQTSAYFDYQGDELFTFFGDDDLWVFIGRDRPIERSGKRYLDSKLVVDIGGVHAPIERKLDLRLSNPKNRAADKTRSLKLNLKQDLGIQAPDDLHLELTVGERYYFYFFFAERHTFGSQFRVETSLRLKTLPKATIEAIQPNAAEPTHLAAAVNGTFKISLNEPAPEGGLVVHYELVDVGVKTAIENQDYTLTPAVHEVVIPAGETAALVTVTPLADVLANEGREEVVAKLVRHEGDRYELGSKIQDTVYITDYVPPPPLPKAILEAIQPNAAEPTHLAAAVKGTFKISLNEPAPEGGLVVHYELVDVGAKTAIENQDYTLTPAVHEVVIPAGETAALVTVTPLADVLTNEGREEVVAKLVRHEGDRYELGSKIQDTVYITDYVPPPPLPKAILEAIQPNAAEPTHLAAAVNGTFKISLNEPAPEGGLVVHYELVDVGAKTAIENQDYTLTPAVHEVVIPAGETAALVTVTPLADVLTNEGREEVVAKLVRHEGDRYELGSKIQDTVYITDYVPPPPPLARITAVRNAVEPRPGQALTTQNIGLFSVSLEGEVLPDTVTIRYRITHQPQEGPHADESDFQPLSGSVAIAKPNRAVEIPVYARADVAGNEVPENVVLELLEDPSYRIPAVGETGRSAKITIVDPPLPIPPTAYIGAVRHAVEPRPGEPINETHVALVRITLVGTPLQPSTTVKYRIITPPAEGPHATHGADYEPLSGFVTIGQPNQYADIRITAKADIAGDEAAYPEGVVLELLEDPASYRVPPLGAAGRSARVLITDVPLPTPIATIEAVDPYAVEPQAGKPIDRGRFVVTLTPKPSAPVLVTYAINFRARNSAQPRDFTLNPTPGQRVWINPQTGQGMITVTAHSDTQADTGERVVAVLLDGDGYDLHPNPRRIADVVVILDADKPKPPKKPELDNSDVLLPQPA